MTLAATDFQTLLTGELDLTAHASAQAQLAVVWSVYADKAFVGNGGTGVSYVPRLQYLYAKRHLLDIILDGWAENRDYKEGITEYKDSQPHAAYLRMRRNIDDEIETAEKQARCARMPQTGIITSTTPVPAPTDGTPDPNNAGYRGDALVRTGWVW